METVDKPIVVDPNVTKAQASTLGRDLLLIAGAIPALIAVLGTRDVNKIVAYLSSTEFAPVAGVLAILATTIYRQWLARYDTKSAVTMAAHVDNSIAVIKKKVPVDEEAEHVPHDPGPPPNQDTGASPAAASSRAGETAPRPGGTFAWETDQ